MTARDLIHSSLRLLGVIASGEAASADEASDALSALNDLIEGWSNERLLIPSTTREVFALTAGTKDYTMGTGGAFSTSRPTRIERALIQVPGTSPVQELPVTVLNEAQYAAIGLKTVTGSYPSALYSDGAYPLTTISVWPVPNQTASLVLYSEKPLLSLADLSTSLSLPPGYARALRYNLAVELAPEYARAIPEVVAAIASESKAGLKRTNLEPAYLKADPALTANSGHWNYMTGEYS